MKKSIVLSVSAIILLFTQTVMAELVVNGSFQDVIYQWDGTKYETLIIPSFNGWSTSPAVQGSNYGLSGLQNAPSTYQVFFAGPGPGLDSVGQAIATVPGTTYTFSFWLAQPQPLNDQYSPGDFRVHWNDSQVLSITDTRQFDWTHYAYNVLATGQSTTINFLARANTSWSDTRGFFLTDISVVEAAPVPVPGTILLLVPGLVGLVGLKRKILR